MDLRRRAARMWMVVSLAGLVLVIPGADAALAAPPTISSFDPTSGPIGSSVQIDGSGFGGSSPAIGVTFNGTAATFSIDSNVRITATVPAGATDGPIAVTDSEGTATSASPFDVTASPLPTITSFDPTTGGVGTSVVITGTNFLGVTGVTFNGTTVTVFTVDSPTQITATVPVGATTGPIAVTTPGGTATSASNFTVIAAPTITSFNPTSGEPGISVVITGTGFTGATDVTFNGTAATFTVNLDTQVTATVPANATTGPIAVTAPGGIATSASPFTVIVTVQTHERTVTLELARHLVARGQVTVTDGFGECAAGVTVRIQRFRDGSWHTIDTAVTGPGGGYREGLLDRAGLYRAVAVRVELNGGDDVCARDRSPRRRHAH